MSSDKPEILAIIIAFRRTEVLRRLLDSLVAAKAEGLEGVILVDNAADPATAELARTCPLVKHYLPQADNLGTGAGHAVGLAAGRTESTATHFWLMDDDMVVPSGTLTELLAGLTRSDAGLAVPLIENAAGHIAWFPGLCDATAWRTIREPRLTAAGYLKRCGGAPSRFMWAPWCMMLLTRETVEMVGVPRTDFGFMGDDLEYSLRISSVRRAVLVPEACARHLPPAVRRGAEARLIDCLHVQNHGYVAFHLPHGRTVRKHWPGALVRVVRKHGWCVLRDLGQAIWHGAMIGRVAGQEGGGDLWRRWRKAAST